MSRFGFQVAFGRYTEFKGNHFRRTTLRKSDPRRSFWEPKIITEWRAVFPTDPFSYFFFGRCNWSWQAVFRCKWEFQIRGGGDTIQGLVNIWNLDKLLMLRNHELVFCRSRPLSGNSSAGLLQSMARCWQRALHTFQYLVRGMESEGGGKEWRYHFRNLRRVPKITILTVTFFKSSFYRSSFQAVVEWCWNTYSASLCGQTFWMPWANKSLFNDSQKETFSLSSPSRSPKTRTTIWCSWACWAGDWQRNLISYRYCSQISTWSYAYNMYYTYKYTVYVFVFDLHSYIHISVNI